MRSAHLAGDEFTPAGPHLTLTRSVPAGATHFWTTMTSGVEVGDMFSFVIEYGSLNAETVTAICEDDEGNELRWRLVHGGRW